PWCSGENMRQRVEKLAHARRQHFLEPREGEGQVALKRCARDRLEHVPTEIQRAQFGEREARLDSLQYLPVEAPVRAAVLVAFVIERKAGFLQRRQIATNGPGRDINAVGERVDRDAVARGFQCVEHFPLPNDCLVAGHSQDDRNNGWCLIVSSSCRFLAVITSLWR